MQQLSKGTPLQGGKYRIEETVAQSDVSITYLATWVAYNLKVCIKEFFMKGLCERSSNTTVVTLTSEGLAAPCIREFLREVRTLASLDHQSIIRVHDRFEENNTAYYVMDFVEGPTLDDVIRKHTRLDEKKAREYAERLADALHYMHEQGITHLGVEAQNVMVRSRDNMPILIDFCLSKHSTGTRNFLPQQDIHDLAALLYLMLTGSPLPSPAEVTDATFATMTDVTPSVVRAIEKAAHPGLSTMPASIPDFLSDMKGTPDAAFKVDLSLTGEEEEDDEEEIPAIDPDLAPEPLESSPEVSAATEAAAAIETLDQQTAEPATTATPQVEGAAAPEAKTTTQPAAEATAQSDAEATTQSDAEATTQSDAAPEQQTVAAKPAAAEPQTPKMSTAEERAASAKRAADMDREAALARSASVERAASATPSKSASTKKAQPVWETKKEPVKTAEELQREKYSAVSQQFAKNMARNQGGNSSGSAGLVVLLVVVVIIALVAYFLL